MPHVKTKICIAHYRTNEYVRVVWTEIKYS